MNVEIRGLDKLEKKFAKMGRDLKPDMAKAMDKAMKYTHGEVPPYPPPPSERYRRTHVMGNAIGTEVRTLGEDIVGVIGVGEVAPYAPYVIDEARQAWWHKRTGWYTLQGVVRNATEGIVEIFNKAIKKLLDE